MSTIDALASVQAALDAATTAAEQDAALMAQLHDSPAPVPVVTDFSGFRAGGGFWGLALPQKLAGKGRDVDVRRLTACSSQYYGQPAPIAADSNTNKLFAARVEGAGVDLSGVTFEAGGQLHDFHGLAVYNAPDAKLHDLRTRGFSAGSGGSPFHETFEIALQAAHRIDLTNVEAFGGTSCASVLGVNNQDGLTATNCVFRGAVYANSATFWKTTGKVVMTDCDFSGSFKPFNSENSTMDAHLVRPILRHYRNSSAFVVRGNIGSVKLLIEDAVHDGPIPIWLGGSTYQGKPNLQKKGDITVLVGGKDVTGDTRYVHFV